MRRQIGRFCDWMGPWVGSPSAERSRSPRLLTVQVCRQPVGGPVRISPLRDRPRWVWGWAFCADRCEQVHCSFLKFRLQQVLKPALSEGLRGKPRLSCTQVLADGWLSRQSSSESLGVSEALCSLPRLHPALATPGGFPSRLLARERPWQSVRERFLPVLLTTGCHAGRRPNLWPQVLIKKAHTSSRKKNHLPRALGQNPQKYTHTLSLWRTMMNLEG